MTPRSRPGSYAVTNDITTNVNSLTIPNSSVTFTVAGGTVFSTLGALNFPGGTINVSGSINCGGLNFTGGTINGPGAINLSGSNSWGGGVFQSTSPGTLTVLSGATLNIYTSGINYPLHGWIYNNNGTNLHTGGQILGGNGTVINNNGLWLEEVDTYFYNDVGGVADLCEQRHLPQDQRHRHRPILGRGCFLLNNSGLVDAQSGEIRIQTAAGPTAAPSTPPPARTTTSQPPTPSTTAAPLPEPELTIWTPAPHFQWRRHRHECGELAMVSRRDCRTLTIPSGSTLNIVSGNSHSMPGAILTNNGTVVDTSGNNFAGTAWTIYNNGLWLEEADHYIYDSDGGLAPL